MIIDKQKWTQVNNIRPTSYSLRKKKNSIFSYQPLSQSFFSNLFINFARPSKLGAKTKYNSFYSHTQQPLHKASDSAVFLDIKHSNKQQTQNRNNSFHLIRRKNSSVISKTLNKSNREMLKSQPQNLRVLSSSLFILPCKVNKTESKLTTTPRRYYRKNKPKTQRAQTSKIRQSFDLDRCLNNQIEPWHIKNDSMMI